ncbi:sulfite exporter TauE/SafE family protein [Maridesulfovibrio bastinii]|uniref:sulfite exporter TauE/SafE family protein n=1 Tax=Maridesulfovibrio bastinii TaxID=47157 RepID=UPI00040A574B|nr:sulfite exporter TauE/SafE family protein [Maridesulfovibrio bastinii]
MTVYIFVPIILFIAGYLQGLTGFGSALIAMPLLAFFIDIKTAVAVCTLCGVLINLQMTLNLCCHVRIKKIIPLILGCIPGTLAGTLLIKFVDGHIITLLLGMLVTFYALYCLFIRPVVLNLRPIWGAVAGFFTGVIASSVSAGGPPTIIYSSLMGWKKNDFKATLASFFLISATMAAAGHLISGITTFYVFKLFLASLPLVLIGVYLGNRLAGRVSEESYKKVVMVLLVIMGLMLMFEGLS